MPLPIGPEIFKMTPSELYEMIRDAAGPPMSERDKALAMVQLVLAKRIEKVVDNLPAIVADLIEQAMNPEPHPVDEAIPGFQRQPDSTPFPAGVKPAPGATATPTSGRPLTAQEEAELTGKAAPPANGTKTPAPAPTKEPHS